MMQTIIDTPETLIHYAIEGHLSKPALTSLLTPPSRPAFLAACTEIEKGYTAACAATGNPCLASGCSCEGEVCLEPLLRAGSEYQKHCGAEWAKLFVDGRHRDAGWKLTAAGYAGADPRSVS
jgi:hypothetical protein